MNFLQVMPCLEMKLQRLCMIMSPNKRIISKHCHSIIDLNFNQLVMHMGKYRQNMEFQKWY